MAVHRPADKGLRAPGKFLGLSPLSQQRRVRSVEGMNSLFETMRNLGFRRGPQRLVAGIGGGIAAKFGVNVWVVRLLILLSFLLPVIGIAVYLLAWAVLPWQDGSIPLEKSLRK